MALRAQLLAQRKEIEVARAQLAREQSAHSTRVSRIDAREAAVRGKERGHEEKEEELRAWHERLQEYETEREWEHWRKDSMRKLQSEIERKVPTEELRQRMQRALTSVELYKRENARWAAMMT